MRLTLKLTLALTGVILVVFVANSLLRVRREVRLFEDDSRGEGRQLGRGVAAGAARVWQRAGEAEALALIDEANERESQVRIRWVWLDAPAGDRFAPELPPALLAPLAQGTTVGLKHRPAGGDEARYTYVPAAVPGARKGAIELRQSLVAEQRYLRSTIAQATLVTLIMVGLSAAITLGLGAVLVGRPVRRLVEHARRIGAGDLSARLELGQRDEIGQLALEMNGMSHQLAVARGELDRATAAKLAALEQLRHADRLATVGKLASGIAHEVGTPLNVITGHAQLITDDCPPSSAAHESALVMGDQARRVAGIIRQLLDFARPRAPRSVAQELGPIASQVAALLDSLAQKRAVSIELRQPAEGVVSRVDAGQLQQVLTNLVVNAVHASSGGGVVVIGAERVRVIPPADLERPVTDYARIYVEDRGTGIPASALPHIFEPFYTTKDPGHGTGLGLSVAYGIVREHGGWIGVESTPGRGSCFSVYLPAEGA